VTDPKQAFAAIIRGQQIQILNTAIADISRLQRTAATYEAGNALGNAIRAIANIRDDLFHENDKAFEEGGPLYIDTRIIQSQHPAHTQ